jgi:hypothetical protein
VGQATQLKTVKLCEPGKPSESSAGGEEWKEFESSAQLCDPSSGSTFAWAVQDGAAWIQLAPRSLWHLMMYMMYAQEAVVHQRRARAGTEGAFDEKSAGGSSPTRLVASITVLPSMPYTLSRASAIAPPETATTTASAPEMSPPSRPILVTSWPVPSQRSASPPPTLPLPITAIFISLLTRINC